MLITDKIHTDWKQHTRNVTSCFFKNPIFVVEFNIFVFLLFALTSPSGIFFLVIFFVYIHNYFACFLESASVKLSYSLSILFVSNLYIAGFSFFNAQNTIQLWRISFIILGLQRTKRLFDRNVIKSFM